MHFFPRHDVLYCSRTFVCVRVPFPIFVDLVSSHGHVAGLKRINLKAGK